MACLRGAKSRIALGVLGVILLAPFARAGSSNLRESANGCADRFALLMKPSALKEKQQRKAEPQKVMSPARLSRAVIRPEKNPKALEGLSEGTYVYTIFEDGSILLARQELAPTARDHSWVVSHRGLKVLHESETGKPARVLAAGEIIVRGGVGNVMFLTNGSGSFPGGAAHLDFAARALGGAGLAVTTRTRRLDYQPLLKDGKSLNRHLTSSDAALLELQWQEDPKKRALLAKVRKALAGLGTVDLEKFVEEASRRAVTADDRTFSFQLLFFLEEWKSPLEPDLLAISNYHLEHGSKGLLKFADQIEALLKKSANQLH